MNMYIHSIPLVPHGVGGGMLHSHTVVHWCTFQVTVGMVKGESVQLMIAKLRQHQILRVQRSKGQCTYKQPLPPPLFPTVLPLLFLLPIATFSSLPHSLLSSALLQ